MAQLTSLHGLPVQGSPPLRMEHSPPPPVSTQSQHHGQELSGETAMADGVPAQDRKMIRETGGFSPEAAGAPVDHFSRDEQRPSLAAAIQPHNPVDDQSYPYQEDGMVGTPRHEGQVRLIECCTITNVIALLCAQ